MDSEFAVSFKNKLYEHTRKSANTSLLSVKFILNVNMNFNPESTATKTTKNSLGGQSLVM